MTTFDASTQPGAGPRYGGDPLAGLDPSEQPVQHYTDPGASVPGANNGGSDISALALLRERVEEREATPVEMWTKEIPRVGVRLVCDPRISNTEFQRWMKASRPKKGNRRGATDATDMDQLSLSCRALAHSNVSIEINKRFGKGGDAEWEELRDNDGDLLTVEHQQVWQLFNVHRADLLLVKLFGRDPAVIDAGQELLGAAGYLGEDDDDGPLD